MSKISADTTTLDSFLDARITAKGIWDAMLQDCRAKSDACALALTRREMSSQPAAIEAHDTARASLSQAMLTLQRTPPPSLSAMLDKVELIGDVLNGGRRGWHGDESNPMASVAGDLRCLIGR